MMKKILFVCGSMLLMITIVIIVLRMKKKPKPAKALKYFKLSEFDDPTIGSGGEKMDKGFMQMMDNAREIAGVPFKINSGYRTPEHNAAVGGVANSAHLKGLAADIAANEQNRDIILKGLYQAGFRRFGIANTYIHVDSDTSKPAPAVWGYGNNALNYTIEKIAAL